MTISSLSFSPTTKRSSPQIFPLKAICGVADGLSKAKDNGVCTAKIRAILSDLQAGVLLWREKLTWASSSIAAETHMYQWQPGVAVGVCILELPRYGGKRNSASRRQQGPWPINGMLVTWASEDHDNGDEG